MRVLAIADEAQLRGLVYEGLRRAGMAVDFAGTLAEADIASAVSRYDCVISDRGLPDGDAVHLIVKLRTAGDPVPALLLTALGEFEADLEVDLCCDCEVANVLEALGFVELPQPRIV